jgi:ketosteroid isomerase-like protein
MSSFRMLLFCAVLLGLLCGCEKRQAIPESRAEDEQTIRNIEYSLSEAIAAKDLDKLIPLYAEDAGLYDEHTPTIRGKKAVREAWRTTLATPGLIMRTEPQTVEISDHRDLGWGHGFFAMTVDDNTGKPFTERWEYAVVYMKPPGDNWRIMADCIYSGVRNHLVHRPQNSPSALGAIAPLIGMGCFLCGVWFLFGMPVVVLVQSCKFFRSGKMSTGFLVSAVMLIAFFVTAVLLWRHYTVQEWNLPFWAALRAAGDTARFGNPVEDTSEDILVSLLMLSTLAAAGAGILTGLTRRACVRRRLA